MRQDVAPTVVDTFPGCRAVTYVRECFGPGIDGAHDVVLHTVELRRPRIDLTDAAALDAWASEDAADDGASVIIYRNLTEHTAAIVRVWACP